MHVGCNSFLRGRNIYMKDFAVYVWFAALVSAYAWNIPVTLAFILRPGAAGVGTGVFVYDGAFRRAEKNALKIKEKRKRLPKGTLKAVRYLLKRVRVEKIFLDGVISAGDAALSALLAGAVWAVSASAADKVVSAVVPDFGNGIACPAVSGIMWVPLGHIIVSGAIILKSTIRERYETWKDTRLKG